LSGWRAVLVAAVALLAPVAARAASTDDDRPRVIGAPGVYVVSSCGIAGRGATEQAARGAFKRAVREARRGWSNMSPRCASLRLTDVVRIRPGQKPAFFVAGLRDSKGADREEAIRRCRAEQAAERAERPKDAPQDIQCGAVDAVFGPFVRKPAWDELDAENQYVFLDDRGTWVDDRGVEICFPTGTPIATPEGDRPIEEIAAGDRVLSWSIDRGAPVEARVTRVKRRHARELLELTLAGGRTLKVSANHPLFVPARADWVPAGELRRGDGVAALAGGRLAPVMIEEIAARVEDADVFDLTIETTHAYFAGGILAHNY